MYLYRFALQYDPLAIELSLPLDEIEFVTVLRNL